MDPSCVAWDTTCVDKVLHLQVAPKVWDTVCNPENARFSRKGLAQVVTKIRKDKQSSLICPSPNVTTVIRLRWANNTYGESEKVYTAAG